MRAIFPYEERRPVAEIYFWSKLTQSWLRYKMIVDSGADYSILPRYCSVDLGIDLKRDCLKKETAGVGGQETVWYLKRKAKIKINDFQLKIPLGFINSDDIPPLLGREGCLNLFRILLANFQTEISI